MADVLSFNGKVILVSDISSGIESVNLLEIKCFKNKINSYDLVNFMRDFRVIDKGDGTYINISQNQSVNEKIKNLIGLTNLDALYLTEKEIENIFEFTMLIDN